MRIHLAVIVGFLALGGVAVWPRPAAAGPPTFLRGTAIETRTVSGSLDSAVRDAAASAGRVWVAWSVPLVEGQGDVCCHSGPWSGHGGGRRGCRLDGREGGVSISGAAAAGDAGELAVFTRYEAGEPRRVRVAGGDCPVDAGAERVVWLDGVAPGESVRLLDGLARRSLRAGPGDEALMALALHADPAADAALVALSGPATPMDLREDAIFWLGQARGERGYREVARIAAQESDTRVLEKVAFSLSQCPVAAAGPALERMAMEHGDSEVRQEAIFWLGQRGDDGVAAKLTRVAQEDADLEVRKKAVFALSQLGDGQGVSPLVDLVRHGRDMAVRREALFWLGQSEDPRALESLEALLLRR